MIRSSFIPSYLNQNKQISRNTCQSLNFITAYMSYKYIKMGCMGSNVNKDEPLSKKNSRTRNQSGITIATNEDEEKMIHHRQRILKKKFKETHKKKTMDEEDLRKMLNQIFDQYDKDQDGCLDLPEFMEMLKMISRRQKHIHFRSFDQQAVRRVLAKNDDDGDISVNRHQFYELYKEL